VQAFRSRPARGLIGPLPPRFRSRAFTSSLRPPQSTACSPSRIGCFGSSLKIVFSAGAGAADRLGIGHPPETAGPGPWRPGEWRTVAGTPWPVLILPAHGVSGPSRNSPRPHRGRKRSGPKRMLKRMGEAEHLAGSQVAARFSAAYTDFWSSIREQHHDQSPWHKPSATLSTLKTHPPLAFSTSGCPFVNRRRPHHNADAAVLMVEGRGRGPGEP